MTRSHLWRPCYLIWLATALAPTTALPAAPAAAAAAPAGSGNEASSVSPIATLTEADIAAGRALFRTHCGRCHGMLGEGGEGPSLKQARLPRAPNDQALVDLMANGIPGTAMPGTWVLTEPERWRIAGYVRSLGALPAEPLPGDAQRGARLYQHEGGCPACHIVKGEGRGVGPELSDVGLRRNAAYLRQSLLDPDAAYPMRWSELTGRRNAFLTVRLTAADGEHEGLRISEDEFSIQLRDLAGRIHSYDKGRLQSFEKAFGHSLMPGYRAELDEKQVEDVVSYLMSLKGR